MQTTIQLTATVDDLLSWRPCDDWTEDRIRFIAGDRTKWTALDVLALEQVPAVDRLWVVLRPELIPEPLLHELACRFAEQALPIWEQQYPDDRRPHKAIAAKREYLRGEISAHELSAAINAAANAAAGAAANAAYAVGAAAGAAARAADAAQAAAWRVSGAAARAAAASARAAQVAIVRELLSRLGGEEE